MLQPVPGLDLAAPERTRWDCSAGPLPLEQDGRCCRRVAEDVCSADLRQLDRPAKVSESWTTVPFLIHLRWLPLYRSRFPLPREKTECSWRLLSCNLESGSRDELLD